jgi:polysaccharide export outer membrane protein
MDVMSEAGGLTEFADGNRAYLARTVKAKRKKYHLRIASLLKSGDMSANIELAPGDIIVIPERWY